MANQPDIILNLVLPLLRVRLVTLEILIISLKLIVTKEDKSVMLDEHFAELEGAREESTLILRWGI